MWKWLIGISAALTVTMGTAWAVSRQLSGLSRPSEVYVRNRVLYGPGGFRYLLTEDDLLWLARATWGEAATSVQGGAAVIWAMAQYHALIMGSGGRRPAFGTFAAMLRSYCQPINPIWASMEGSGCQRQPNRCTESHLARRRQITTASWESIPATVRQLVLDFARGQLPNPVPGAVDWNNLNWGDRSQIPVINVAGNYFGVGANRRMYQA